MNILNIAIKEIKRDFRDFRTLVWMLAFPLVFILIMGTALTNAFDGHTSIENIHVLYKDTTRGGISQYFDAFVKEAGKNGVHFEQTDHQSDALNEVKQNHYEGFVEISNDGIQFYGNDKNSLEDSIVQGMLTAFADKYNLAAAIAKVDPAQVHTAIVNNTQGNLVKEVSLQSAKQPGSMDYYAISITTMIAFYSAMSAMFLIRSERIRKTADRLIASPISKGEIFLGKLLGSIVVNSLCIGLLIVFSKFVYKANWGNHIGLVCLVLLTEVIFAISFGLGVSYITKTEGSARAIVMIVIQVAAFIGGAYYKMSDTSGVPSFSPLTWANTTILKIIYADDLRAAIPTISLNIGVAILFLLVSVLSLRRREGL